MVDGASHRPGADPEALGVLSGVLKFGVWESRRERLDETWVEQSS